MYRLELTLQRLNLSLKSLCVQWRMLEASRRSALLDKSLHA
jgi:hypothetical protein